MPRLGSLDFPGPFASPPPSPPGGSPARTVASQSTASDGRMHQRAINRCRWCVAVSRVLSWTIIYLDTFVAKGVHAPICAQAGGTPIARSGFAPSGVYRAPSLAGWAVRSYRTLSPLPVWPWPRRRFAFCGTFPAPPPATGRPDLPVTLPCGARTFLDPRGERDRLATAKC